MTSVFEGAQILITGGAGCIGSHIADQALAAGAARVVVLDDFVEGKAHNLGGAFDTGRLTLIGADLCDAAVVDRATRGVDFVFHLAALRPNHCAQAPQRAVDVMIRGTQNVLDAAVHHAVSKVIAASSAAVYGEPSYLPMGEPHPFNNRSLYGALKIANEQMLRSYAEMYGLRYVALRPFNLYGPRMDACDLFSDSMICWLERLSRGEAPVIFGDGTQTTDLVYVEDVARAYLQAAGSSITDDVFNVGTGEETSLRDLCALMCEAAGHADLTPVHELPRTLHPISRRRAGIERARRVLRFQATTPLPEGLRRLAAWFAEATATKQVEAQTDRG
jgi:UDP-glucose 4-epimerase